MKALILLILFLSFSASAQLEKPLLVGECAEGKTKLNVEIQNEEVRIRGEKMSCIFAIDNASLFLRRTQDNVSFYIVPSCKEKDKFIDRGFVSVDRSMKSYIGLAHLFKDGKPINCHYKSVNWDKLKELAKKKKKGL